jgi:hypothetical protein
MQLTQALQEKIAEHMPALVAGELKDFITKAEATAAELERARDRLKSSEASNQDLREKLEQHRELDRKLEEIASRERELAGRELQVRYDVAANRASVAEGKLEVLSDMMKTVFRNTEVRRQVLESVPVPVDATPRDQYGGCGSPAHVQTHTKTSTVTEENK